MEATIGQPTARSTAAERARNSTVRDNLLRLGSLVVILGVWEWYGRSVNPLLFAPISSIAIAASQSIASGELWKYLSPSLVLMFQGLGLAMLIGVPLGVLMGRIRVVDTILEPYINALNATPSIAFVALLTLWFGSGTLGKTFVVFIFSVFGIILNTHQGVRNVETTLIEVARSFCTNERQMWRDVIIPSAVPYILVGFRLAIGRALVGIVIADFLMEVSGIGYLVNLYQNSFQVAKQFVPILTLMFLGVVLTEGAKLSERRLMPWLSANRAE